MSRATEEREALRQFADAAKATGIELRVLADLFSRYHPIHTDTRYYEWSFQAPRLKPWWRRWFWRYVAWLRRR